MRQVRSKDTTLEFKVRSLIHRLGYRFRLHQAELPGKPDLVFPSRKKAIFVHGCFWHGHDCARGSRIPKTNVDYWVRKIRRNTDRDAKTRVELELLGWSSFIVWECGAKNLDILTTEIVEFLKS